MTEQSTQDIDDLPVQSTEKAAVNQKKARTQEEKIGRIKYNQFLLKRVLEKIETVERRPSVLFSTV